MFEGMIVIGENINATRKVLANGKKVVEYAPGKKGYPYQLNGEDAFLDLNEALESEVVLKSGRVNYIAVGIANRDEQFMVAMAQNQERLGADFIDVCVDECSPFSEERCKHMVWCVQTLQKHLKVPMTIDSSDSAVLAAGLEVYDASVGRPMINSVNLEPARLPVLDLVKKYDTVILGNGSGETGLPDDTKGRVENLTALMRLMDEKEIPLADRTLDPLVLPVSTNPEYGMHYLNACQELREKFGPEFHMTGGFSNVSFGLPNRRMVNEAFTFLAREHGCDTAFIDPAQVREFKTEDEGWELALTALRGEDPYCMMYTAHFRG